MRVVFVLLILSLGVGLDARRASAQQADDPGISGSRVALVIGNASYPSANAPLTQPAGNARALGEELTRDGFQVEVGENLTKEGMQRYFGRLYDRIKPGAVALIFFSGYGIQSDRQSYMIPVDGQVYKEGDVRRDGISVDSVLSEMNNKGASVKVAILDASMCSRFETNFRRACLGLAIPANPPSGTLIIYSAEPGSVVREAANDRGVFMTELLKEMAAPGVPAETVFNRTRMGVVRATQGAQKPSNLSSLHVDFAFGPQVPELKPQILEYTPEAAPGPLTTPSDPVAESRHDYELAEQAGTRKAWEDFLSKHPSGSYAELAREQLAKFDAPAGLDSKPIPVPLEVRPSTDVKDLDEIKDLDQKLQSNVGDAAAYYRRGQLYAKAGNFSHATTDFDEAIRLLPKDHEALNNRCWARAMAGDFQLALKDCDEAIRLQPGYADALDSRGFIKLKMGQPSGAIADYDAALQIKKQASSLYGRGIAKKQTGDTTGADGDIAAAKDMDPAIAAEFEKSGVQ